MFLAAARISISVLDIAVVAGFHPGLIVGSPTARSSRAFVVRDCRGWSRWRVRKRAGHGVHACPRAGHPSDIHLVGLRQTDAPFYQWLDAPSGGSGWGRQHQDGGCLQDGVDPRPIKNQTFTPSATHHQV